MPQEIVHEVVNDDNNLKFEQHQNGHVDRNEPPNHVELVPTKYQIPTKM